MEGFKYPVPVTRSRCITKLGGRTRFLESDQIGLHIGALVSNTSLSLENDILVDKPGKKGNDNLNPLYTRKKHRLEPITDLHDSRALAMASDGEAVLSEEDPLEVEEGDEIVLNAAVDTLPEDWVERLIYRYFEDRYHQ